jgi:hypothetical protein
MVNICSGEQFQELCFVYIGYAEDFVFNPRIASQSSKHLPINAIPDIYYNPPIIFCYTHRVKELELHLNKFQYPFILISHNADTNIDDTYHSMANHPKIFHWFTQNLNTDHGKISLLPIGAANTQWAHGKRELFVPDYSKQEKLHDLYFQFGPSNIHERQRCYEAVSRYYQFQPQLESSEYLKMLSCYRFCISPEGNGVDCHRIWEALLCNCIPIISDSAFARHIAKDHSVIVVKDWYAIAPEFIDKLEHKSPDKSKLDIAYYTGKIMEKAGELYKKMLAT